MQRQQGLTEVSREVRQGLLPASLRAAGKIPAVIYGHGTDPVHVALPAHQMPCSCARPTRCSSSTSTAEPARPRQGRPEGPGSPDHRAHRPHRRPQGREGPGRSSRSHVEGEVLPARSSTWDQDPPARGRGHPHPRARRHRRRRASKTAPRSTPRTSRCPRAPRSSPTLTRSSSTSTRAAAKKTRAAARCRVIIFTWFRSGRKETTELWTRISGW